MNSFKPESIKEQVLETLKSKKFTRNQLIAQIIDFAQERYPSLIMRPVGVQEMKDKSLVLIEFSPATHPDEIKIKEMKRYKLVPMAEVPLARQQAAP